MSAMMYHAIDECEKFQAVQVQDINVCLSIVLTFPMVN